MTSYNELYEKAKAHDASEFSNEVTALIMSINKLVKTFLSKQHEREELEMHQYLKEASILTTALVRYVLSVVSALTIAPSPSNPKEGLKLAATAMMQVIFNAVRDMSDDVEQHTKEVLDEIKQQRKLDG